MMSITVAHEWKEADSQHEAEIERAADHVVIAKAEIPATLSDITVSAGLPRFATGPYFLKIYGLREGSAGRTPVAQTPLALME